MEKLSHLFARHLATTIGIVQPWADYNGGGSINDHQDNTDDVYHNNQLYPTVNDPYQSSSSTTTTTNATGMMNGPAPVEPVPWWYTFCFFIFFAALICFSFAAREYCYRTFGCQMCHTFLADHHHSQHPLGSARNYITHRGRGGLHDQISAASDELREQELIKQRQERRLWYLYYLRPFTMVLTKENFEVDEENSERLELAEEAGITGKATATSNPSNQQQLAKDELVPDRTSGGGLHLVLDADSEVDLHDIDLTEDVEAGMTTAEQDTNNTIDKGENNPCDQHCHDNILDEELGTAFSPKMMTLWDPHASIYRQMEANCTICLSDYNVGDTIVRSASGQDEEYCFHVFHYECMLQWLSQGKKRCPICRHWFVPPIRVKEQMKTAHVVTRPGSLHHLYNADRGAIVASIADTESNMSRSSTNSSIDDDANRDIDVDDVIIRSMALTSSPNSVDNHDHQHHHHHNINIHPSRLHSFQLDASLGHPRGQHNHNHAHTTTYTTDHRHHHHRRHSYPLINNTGPVSADIDDIELGLLIIRGMRSSTR